MAPHIQRDYHSIGDPGRYPLRTLRHGEKNFLPPHNFDVSKINGKEDFLRCIGLQIRRSQYEYKMSDSDNKAKKINIPKGVILRDCRVVILETICELCGKCFKCETDLNMHITMQHRAHGKIRITTMEGIPCVEDEVELWNKSSECLNYITDSHVNITKVRKKIRLILKIGEEIVNTISLKRKHLKKKKVSTCIQNKLHRDTKLIIDNDVYENVSCIDPAVFVNSPYQCCKSVHALQSSNRYLASNIVAGKQAIRGKSITQGENYVSNELKESYTTTTSVEYDIHNMQSKEVPFESNLTFVNEKVNLHEQNVTKNSNSNKLSSIHSNNVSVLNETCPKLQFTETSNPILDCDKRSDSIKSLPKSTNTSSKPIVQAYLQNSENENNTEERDINANQIHKVFTIDRKDQSALEKVQNVTVIFPVILPIIVPNNNAPSSPFKVTIQSSSVEQKEQQQQQKQGQRQEAEKPQESQPQQIQDSQLRQKLIQNCIYDIEDNSDDEVQEVLRIVRRCSSNPEINHESPTRFEQEMLVQDAIKDMKKMEEGGWHLLEKKIAESTKKRKRNTKTNNKCNDTTDESAKKKKKTISEPNSDSNLKNLTGEKYISNAKEHAAKVQSYNSIVTMWASDNVKENLTCNKNIDVSSDMLRRYGINYYNEVFEINNNTDNIQEPVSRFLVPCSGGMENRSNGPAVIDLVNGTDE